MHTYSRRDLTGLGHVTSEISLLEENAVSARDRLVTKGFCNSHVLVVPTTIDRSDGSNHKGHPDLSTVNIVFVR